MGPSATTLMMSRSRVPCRRSNLSSVFMPMASTYILGPVEGQGVCFGVPGSGHNRELTRGRKLYRATVASMRLQNAILGPKSAEFNDQWCQQLQPLIEPVLFSKFRSKRLLSGQNRIFGELLPAWQ